MWHFCDDTQPSSIKWNQIAGAVPWIHDVMSSLIIPFGVENIFRGNVWEIRSWLVPIVRVTALQVKVPCPAKKTSMMLIEQGAIWRPLTSSREKASAKAALHCGVSWYKSQLSARRPLLSNGSFEKSSITGCSYEGKRVECPDKIWATMTRAVAHCARGAFIAAQRLVNP